MSETNLPSVDLPSNDPQHRMEEVVDYHHGDLTPEARAAFEVHLATCPGCQKSVKLAAWAFPALNEVLLKGLPTPEAQVARFLDKTKGAQAPKHDAEAAAATPGFWTMLQRRWLWVALPAALGTVFLLWVGPKPGSAVDPNQAAAPISDQLRVRVTAVQAGSVTVELAEDPGKAFLAVFVKTPDGSLQRLKPRPAGPKTLVLDVQPGSEWLLFLLGAGPEEPADFNRMVMTAVQKDPGITNFPELPGVDQIRRLPIPASVP
jgi:Putative zinc-finger